MFLRLFLLPLAFTVYSTVSASGQIGSIPVTDAAQLAQGQAQLAQIIQTVTQQAQQLNNQLQQIANQTTQIQNQARQITEMQNQLTELRTQVTSITGNKGMGALFNTPQDIANRVRTNDLASMSQDILGVAGGSNMSPAAQQTANGMMQQFDIAPIGQLSGSPETFHRIIAEQAGAGVAAVATAADSFEQTNDAMGRVNNYVTQIDTAPDIKASIDLNNRLMAEQLQMTAELIRLTAALTNTLATREVSQARAAFNAEEWNEIQP